MPQNLDSIAKGNRGRRAGSVSSAIPVLILVFAILVFSGWWYLKNRPGAVGGGGGGVPAGSKAALRVHGSNTIGAELGPGLAVEFLKSLGAANIQKRTTGADEMEVSGTVSGDKAPTVIEIQAHGSGTAFTDLVADKCDVGMASRKITDKETASASAAGLGDLTALASEHVVGLDGIAVIVNKSNPVRSLTKDQINRMFSGAISDWSQAGGDKGPIHVFARDDKSGTWDTFKTLVLKDDPLVTGASRLEDSRELSAKVSEDQYGIGFIGLPYVLNAKAVAVSDAGTAPSYPTRFTVATEEYPLTRRLYFYIPGNSQNRLAQRFIAFAESKPGQDVVDQNKFVSQNVNAGEGESNGAGSGRYKTLTNGKTRLSLNYYFQSGKAVLDNRATLDIQRVIDFLADLKYSGKGVVLIGFADSQGPEPANLAVSEGRAEAVAVEFRARGIQPEVVGLGSAQPVASNADPIGRERNRRVEIWINR